MAHSSPPPARARRQMLSYADSSVTKNASEKKINSLLDFMAGANDMEVGGGDWGVPYMIYGIPHMECI